MSYSFSKIGPNGAAVKALIAAELDAILETQPEHAADKALIMQTVIGAVDLIHVNEAKNLKVTVAGSVYAPPSGVQQVSLSVHAVLLSKPKIPDPVTE